MTRYLAAVSGGVDSVVLLDTLAQSTSNEVIVAHFDHGIRPESKYDAQFVERLAARYGIACVSGRAELGTQASEATARRYRYTFLKKMAAQHQAQIVTAHHQDDLIETIAINFVRGTGWRGLAVFGDRAIYRPLVMMTKREIYDYAIQHKLEWVEDATNRDDRYLRNRLRRVLVGRVSTMQKRRLVKIWQSQSALASEIGAASQALIASAKGEYSRYFFTMVDEMIALELLRTLTAGRATRPQLARGLIAIKTTLPGKTVTLSKGVHLMFTKRTFVVETL